VFSTFGHFSKVKSHVFLTSRRLSRFGSKLRLASPGQKVVVLVFLSPQNTNMDLAHWATGISGDFRIFRFLGRIQFGVDFRRKSPNPGQKVAIFMFFGPPKTNWGERKPAQIWLVLAFSGPF